MVGFWNKEIFQQFYFTFVSYLLYELLRIRIRFECVANDNSTLFVSKWLGICVSVWEIWFIGLFKSLLFWVSLAKKITQRSWKKL
jgi:hypothetical protein